MIEAVTRERWNEAQVAEIQVATYDIDNSRRAYQHIFDYLGITANQSDKLIIEVGCGPYPAAMFCDNLSAIVFEPLFSRSAECGSGIAWIRQPFEDAEVDLGADEVWLFNVLQHVRDPEAVVAKAKQVASVVRYFEPVDYGTCIYHPHTFSEADFNRWFPGSVKRYTDRLPAFFDSDCCYGSYSCLNST